MAGLQLLILVHLTIIINQCGLVYDITILSASPDTSLTAHSSTSINKENCLDEEITTKINGQLVKFVWSTNSQTTLQGGYISTPPCLDENLQLLERFCNFNGEWSSPKTCFDFQKDIPLCPPGYKQLSGESLCYYLTNISPWPPKCPFPDEWSSFFDLYFKLDIFLPPEINRVWFPAFRNLTYGFGSLQMIGFSKHNILDYLVITNETLFMEHSCIAIDRTQGLSMQLISCKDYLPGLCFFLKPEIVYQPQIDAVVYYNRHLPDKVGFYKVYGENNNTLRNDFCEKLAEPIDENLLMTLKSAFILDTCWIGLERNTSGIFVWSQTKNSIKYANWDVTTNFSNTFGVLNANNFNNNWTLLEDYYIDCALCETPIQYESVTLDLIYDKQAGLVLKQYNKFKQFNDTMCYTNADNLITVFEPVITGLEQGCTIYGVNISSYAGQYWCQSFDPYLNNFVSSNTVIILGDSVKFEYVLRAIVYFNFETEPTENLQIYSYHLEILLKDQDQVNITSVRVMAIENIDQSNNEMSLIFHISTDGGNFNEINEFYFLTDLVASFETNELFIRYGKLARSNVCFQTSVWINPSLLLSWNTTYLGDAAAPDHLCLIEGQLANRLCEGNFLEGAYWSKFDSTCDSVVINNSSNITQELYRILISTQPANQIIESVLNLTKQPAVINFIDVSISTKILEKLMTDVDNLNLTGSLEIVSNLMDSNYSSLNEAQKINTTDRILEIIDLMPQLKFENDLLEVKTCNIRSHVIDLSLRNVSGVALRYRDESENFTNFDTYYLTSDSSEEDLLQIENVEIAVCIPKQLLEYLLNEANDTLYLVISIFYKESLFNNDDTSLKIGGRTISITIPGFETLPVPLPVWFRNFKTKSVGKCAYWHYGIDEMGEPLKGSWKEEQDAKLIGHHYLSACQFSHLTHFGLLVDDESLTSTQDTILSILTAVGIALSSLGIFGIVVTTFVYKTWRTDRNHQILLQICLVTVVQYLLFYAAVSELVNASVPFCIFTAVSFHYVILSQFCWMLVIALLQYRRFVIVFGAVPSHILLKTGAVGWLLPAVPTIITIVVSPKYEISHNICYPTGLTLWLGVLLPIALIICSNVFIFAKIIYSLPSRAKLIANAGNKNLIMSIVHLGISLFFILGLSWIFGLFAAFGGGIVFLYLFCLTATLQGLVLFLYFIVLNEKTKPLWYKFIRMMKCASKDHYFTNEYSVSFRSDKTNIS